MEMNTEPRYTDCSFIPFHPSVSSFEFNAFGPTWNSLDFTSKRCAIFSRAALCDWREGEIDSQIGGMRFKALIQTALVDESLVDINNFWNFVLRKGVGGIHFCEFLWTSYAFHEVLNSPRLNERTINNPRSMG